MGAVITAMIYNDAAVLAPHRGRSVFTLSCLFFHLHYILLFPLSVSQPQPHAIYIILSISANLHFPFHLSSPNRPVSRSASSPISHFMSLSRLTANSIVDVCQETDGHLGIFQTWIGQLGAKVQTLLINMNNILKFCLIHYYITQMADISDREQ